MVIKSICLEHNNYYKLRTNKTQMCRPENKYAFYDASQLGNWSRPQRLAID